ncbi:MAG TPA: GerMN domain-containing protein [Candidatus Acidoferrales bacterium]|nr:GerMN domain-containing protein [Candidatus Acidoferrales bacterium]
MTRNWRIFIVVLAVGVVIGLISLRSLHRRMKRLAQTEVTEEQARHDLLAPPVSTPTDVPVKATIFWAGGPDSLAPIHIELPLSADPVQRSRQLLSALIADPPTPDQRTLPADAEVLGFYILPDGTAIADFSDALSTETPSGILSERMAVDSIVKTLANNVPGLHRLKILIHGQEVDTLAGHIDLTGFFDLNPAVQQGVTPAAKTAPSSSSSAAPPKAFTGNAPPAAH